MVINDIEMDAVVLDKRDNEIAFFTGEMAEDDAVDKLMELETGAYAIVTVNGCSYQLMKGENKIYKM